MIYWRLLWEFLKVGTFSFGGAYGSIPLIRDIVLSNGWLSDEMVTYFIAVSESTPGSIMVNMATYIGSSQAGFWGAALATFGVVLPSFVIILAIVAVMKNFIRNPYVQAVLQGIMPCFIGIVLAMGLYMTVNNVLSAEGGEEISGEFSSADWRAAAITGVLLALSFGYQHCTKKDFSPIFLIVFSAVLGIAAYALPL